MTGHLGCSDGGGTCGGKLHDKPTSCSCCRGLSNVRRTDFVHGESASASPRFDIAEDFGNRLISDTEVRQVNNDARTSKFKSRTSWKVAFVLLLVIAFAHAEDFSPSTLPESSPSVPDSVLRPFESSPSSVGLSEALSAVYDEASRYPRRRGKEVDGGSAPRRKLYSRRFPHIERRAGRRRSNRRRGQKRLDRKNRKQKFIEKEAPGRVEESSIRWASRDHPLIPQRPSSRCTTAPLPTRATRPSTTPPPTTPNQKTERDTPKQSMPEIESSGCNTTLTLSDNEDRRVGFLTSKGFDGNTEAPYECIFNFGNGIEVAIYFTEYYLRTNLTICDEDYTPEMFASWNFLSSTAKCDSHDPLESDGLYKIHSSFVNISLDTSEDVNFRVGCGDFNNKYGFNLTYEMVRNKPGNHGVIRKNGASTIAACNYNGIPKLQRGANDDLYFVCECFPAYTGANCQYGPLNCYTDKVTDCMNSSSKLAITVNIGKRDGVCNCISDHICSECNKFEACNNHGTCRMHKGQFYCDCDPKYMGAHCEDSYLSVPSVKNKSECVIDGRQCEHACHQLRDHYFCSCPAGKYLVNKTECIKNETYQVNVEFHWHSKILEPLKDNIRELNKGLEIKKMWRILYRNGRVGIEYTVTDPEALAKLMNTTRWRNGIPQGKEFLIGQAPSLSVAPIQVEDFKTTLRLMCEAVGSSELTFEWLKDNFTIFNLTDQPCSSHKTPGSLGRIFTKITPENEKCTSYLTIEHKKSFDYGQFSCRVRDGFQDEIMHIILPKPSDSPQVEVWPPVVTILQGGNITLHCGVEQVWRSEEHSFMWYADEDSSAVGRTYRGRKQTILGKGSNYTLTNVTETINITCHVKNLVEENIANQATVHVVVLSQKAKEQQRYCDSEEHLHVWWHFTKVNTCAVERCPDGFKGLAVRECEEQQSGGLWARPNFADCIYDQLVPLMMKLQLFDNGYPLISDWNSFAGLVLNALDKRQGWLPAMYPGEGLIILNVTGRMNFTQLFPQNFFPLLQYLTTNWGALHKQNIRNLASLIRRYHMERRAANKSSSVTLSAFNATSDVIKVQDKVLFQGNWSCTGNSSTSPQHVEAEVATKDPSSTTSVTLLITVIADGPRLINYMVLVDNRASELNGVGLVYSPLVFIDAPKDLTYNFVTTVRFHLPKNYVPSDDHQMDKDHVPVCGQTNVLEVGEKWFLGKCSTQEQTKAETTVVTCMCDGTGVVSLLKVKKNITDEYAGWKSNIAVGICCSTCGLTLLVCAVLLLLQHTYRMLTVQLRVVKILSLVMALLILAYIALQPISKESFIVVLVIMACCVVFSSGVSVSQQMVLYQQLSSVRHVLPMLPVLPASPAALTTALVSLMSLALGGILWTMQYVNHFNLSSPWDQRGTPWEFLLAIGIFLVLMNVTWLFIFYANIYNIYKMKNTTAIQDVALPMDGQVQRMAVLHLLEICFVVASLFRNHEKAQFIFCISTGSLSVMVIAYYLVAGKECKGCFPRILHIQIGKHSEGYRGGTAGACGNAVGEAQNTTECPKNDAHSRTAAVDFRQRGGSMLSQGTTSSFVPHALSSSSYNDCGALPQPPVHSPKTRFDIAMENMSMMGQHERHITHVEIPGSHHPVNAFDPENCTSFDGSENKYWKQLIQDPSVPKCISPDFRLNHSCGSAHIDFHETPVESWQNGLQVLHDPHSRETSKHRYLPMDPRPGNKSSCSTEIPTTCEAILQHRDVRIPFFSPNSKADVGLSVRKKILNGGQKRNNSTSSKQTFFNIKTNNSFDKSKTKTHTCYSNLSCSCHNLSPTLPPHEIDKTCLNEYMPVSCLTSSSLKMKKDKTEDGAEELAILSDKSQNNDDNECENHCIINRANSDKLKQTNKTREKFDVEHKDCCKPLLDKEIQEQEMEVVHLDITKKMSESYCWGNTKSFCNQVNKDSEEVKEHCTSEPDLNAVVQTKKYDICRQKVSFSGEQSERVGRKDDNEGDGPMMDHRLKMKKKTLFDFIASTFPHKPKNKMPIHNLADHDDKVQNLPQCLSYKVINYEGEDKVQNIVDKGGGITCLGTTDTTIVSEDVSKSADNRTVKTLDCYAMATRNENSPKFTPESKINKTLISPVQMHDSVSVHSSPSCHNLSISPIHDASLQPLNDCPDKSSSVTLTSSSAPVQVCHDAHIASIQVQDDIKYKGNVDHPFLKNSEGCEDTTEDLSVEVARTNETEDHSHNVSTKVYNIIKSRSTSV